LIVPYNKETWEPTSNSITDRHETVTPSALIPPLKSLVNPNRKANRKALTMWPAESHTNPDPVPSTLAPPSSSSTSSSPPLRPRDDEVLDEHHRRRRLLHAAGGQSSAATRMRRERERRGGGVTWNRRTTRASSTSSSSAAARAGRGGGAPAAAARRRSAAAAVRLGATAKGWSGVGATVNGLVWHCGRGGRGGFTLFIPKGAPGASYLAGHGAVTKFS